LRRVVSFKASKKNLTATLLLALVLSTTQVSSIAFSATNNDFQQQQTTTEVYIDPPLAKENPTQRFNVSIVVANVIKLNTWGAWIQWKPWVLNVTPGRVWEGPFLTSGGGSTLMPPPSINNDAGTIFVGSGILDQGHVNGTGVVVTIEFFVKSLGETSLDLYDTSLIAPDFTPISHETSDGYFFNLPSKVYVDPESNSADVLQTFTINITAAYVLDLYSWELKLTWKADKLNATTAVEGPFLKSDGATTEFYYEKTEFENATGKYERIFANCTRQGVADGVNISGTIMSVTFLVEKTEQTFLDISEDLLRDSTDQTITHSTHDGLYTPVAVSVAPPRNTARVNASFTINIEVANVSDLYSWKLNLVWEPDVLNITSVSEGPFLKSGGSTLFNSEVDNSAGQLSANCTLVGVPSGVSGTGVLANITFFVRRERDRTMLDLFETQLLNSEDAEILHRTIDGVFTNIPPVAIFTYLPATPAVNQPITFNATNTYDLDPDGFIAGYTWNFGDGNVTSVTNKVITHVYTAIGNYNVNLTATDNDGLNGTTAASVSVKRESSLTISASQTAINLTQSTTISGTLDPAMPSKPIAISKRPVGTEAWVLLTSVDTDDSGHYSYVWTPDNAGAYEIRASWAGDEDTLPAESSIVTIIVKATSTISIAASPTAITYGQTATITGSITPTRQNQPVTIWYRKSGTQTFSNITSTKTNQTSQYTYTWTPPSAGTVEIKASWPGDEITLAAETSIASITVNKVESTLTMSVSPTSITYEQTVTISGSLTPTKVNAGLTLQQRKAGETTWQNITTVQTDQNSQYTYTWKPPVVGTFELRAVWSGDPNTLSDESTTQTLQVTEAPSTNLFLYAGIGIAIVIIISLLIYFTKIRKPK